MTANTPDQQMNSFLQAPLVKIVILGFLVMMLMIPVALIAGVISERRSSRDEVIREVTSSWGYSQKLIGPWIVVPYDYRWREADKDGKEVTRKETRYAWFLPENLEAIASQSSEIRYRGIYKVPLYRAEIKFRGRFPKPDLSSWVADPADIQWGNCHLVMRVSDVRALVSRAYLQWNQSTLEFQPGTRESVGNLPGIHIPLGEGKFNESNEFSFSLAILGSDGLYFAPFGRDTKVLLTGNWPDPSFQGQWLPSDRKISKDGFQAEWRIPFLGRNYPEKWTTGQGIEQQIDATVFGVDLHIGVDEYRMAQRSVKYAILFLVLLFSVLWLFEVKTAVGVHPMNYLLVGVAICLFYLLELSLAEHLGFDSAYSMASIMVIILVSGYCASVLASFARAVIVAFVLALLYAYLHVVLVNQDFALLLGSLGLFVMLAIVMFVTRGIKWDGGPQN